MVREASARRPIAGAFAVLALACVPYLDALANDFTLDDRLVAKAFDDNGEPNPFVAEPRPITDYFKNHYWAARYPASELYRPVTVASYALVYQALGRRLGEAGEAVAQHAVNVALHGLCALVALGLLLRFGVPGPGAWAGAAVFATHAIHTEVVAGVVGRAELLGFACGGLGVWLLGRGCREAILAVFCFAVAFFSKENAVAWAPFGVLYEWLRTGRLPRALAAVGCTAAPALCGFLALRAAALADLPPVTVAGVANPLFDVSAADRVRTAAWVWAHGLGLLVWPAGLVSDYGPATFAVETRWASVRVAAGLGALVGVAVLGGWAWRRKRPAWALAAAATLGFSLITSNLLFPIGTIFAERLWFAPSLGLALAVAGAWRRRWRRALAVFCSLWIAGNVARTVDRVADWRDDLTLASADVATNPRSARLQARYARALAWSGRVEAAVPHMAAAIAIAPRYARFYEEMGAWLARLGRREEAEIFLRRGLAAPEADPRTDRARLHARLGRLLAATDRADAAWPHLVEALRLGCEDVLALDTLLMLAPGRVAESRITRWIGIGERVAPLHPLWAYHRAEQARRLGDRAAEARARAMLDQLLHAPWCTPEVRDLMRRR